MNQVLSFSEVSANEFLEIDTTGTIQIKSKLDFERQSNIEYMVSYGNLQKGRVHGNLCVLLLHTKYLTKHTRSVLYG